MHDRENPLKHENEVYPGHRPKIERVHCLEKTDTVAHNKMRWPIQREHNKQVSSSHPQPNERIMQNEQEEEIQNCTF